MPFFSIQSPSSGNATQLQGRAVSATAPSGGQVLGWDGSAWVPAAGVTGPTGVAGVDAPKLLWGTTGPVAGYGKNGDWFIDSTAGVLYGPRTNGAWGTGLQLQSGPQGPTGPAGVGSTGPASTTPGPTGERGATGERGQTGPASTVPGPQGNVGATGPTGFGATGAVGPPAGITIGTVVSGSTPSATLTGPAGSQVLNLVLARGATGAAGGPGATGPIAGLAIGSVNEGGSVGAAITPDGAGGYLLDLTLPRGAAGSTGAASTVPGPTGATGASVTGPTGAASTVPGPTGAAGQSIVGPTGATGAASSVPGPTGPTGESIVGPTGATGAASTVPGPTGAAGQSITGPTGAASTVTGPTGPAGAGGGGSGEDALLRSIFVPPAPTGLTATAGNAQVALSWTAPTGVVAQAPITDYREQFSADGGTTWTTFSAAASTATSATVTGLTNGTAYVFRVAAINAVGVGAYTAASAAVTPTAFSPTSIAGLQLWTDASDASTLFDATSGGSLVAADGGVARWQDKSGNARHFTQATSGSRPLRKTGQQNGLATLRFDGSNDSMSIASSTATFKFAHDGDSTLFIVYKAGTTANPNTLYAIIGNGISDGSIDLQTGFYLRWDDRGEVPYQDQSGYVVANSGTPRYAGVSAANTFPANVFNLQTIVSNPQDSTIANRATIRRNGGSAVSVTTSDTNAGTALPTANATQDLRIGATSGTATWFLAGDIAEIIMYDSALSDANRGLVESYLMSKWGIS